MNSLYEFEKYLYIKIGMHLPWHASDALIINHNNPLSRDATETFIFH